MNIYAGWVNVEKGRKTWKDMTAVRSFTFKSCKQDVFYFYYNMPRNKSLNVNVPCVKTKKHESPKFISFKKSRVFLPKEG